MSKKISVFARVDESAFHEYCKVVESDHMEPQRFTALLISKFGDLKQGHALRALASIPQEHFKLRPGRTPTKDAPVLEVAS